MLNKAQLIGNLRNDPEVRYLEDGTCVANVSIATTEKWKDKRGEKQSKTEWHRVSFFGKLAEIVAEYCQKGMTIYVEGRIETRKWTDKEGIERYTTGIKGDDMKMLSFPKQDDGDKTSRSQPSSSNNHGTTRGEPNRNDDPFPEDDIPF